MNDNDTLADDLRKDSLALMKLLADEKHKSEALAAELAVEKMQHSVTIADEHESRSEFQDRIRALEARNADALRQLEIARERIQHLNAGIYIVHTMRLNWGLSCPCKCHECDILFEGIRDHLPEGSEAETSAQREVAK